jgi:mono/diheme cytochrome c family protein
LNLPWPFALRPSLAAWAEPSLRPEIVVGIGLLGLALAVLVLAWRLGPGRLRWLLAALAAADVLFLAAPRLDLLLVPAYPTSFFTSPTGFSATSIARGEAVFVRHCQSCHGIDGKGDGPEAARQAVPPADLTAAHLWDHPDGEMFWWVSNGIAGPDGRPSMPGFAGRLDEGERWAVIDYLHAHAAGTEMAGTGRWPHEFMAPDMMALCADGRRITLSDLGGKPVHVVVDGEGELPRPGTRPALLVGAASGRAVPEGYCAVPGPEARRALAITLALGPDDIGGSQFVIGPEGWLLGHWYQGGAPSPETIPLEAEILRSTCLARDGPGHRHSGRR